jgi:hypothetical protein
MKLSRIAEGIVSTSRGRIVNVKNDIATMLADAIRDMGFKEPDVEFADSTTEDAILYVDIADSTLMVRIISDDDIQIQVPRELSDSAKIHDYQKLGSPKHVIKALQRIRLAIRERLIDRL